MKSIKFLVNFFLLSLMIIAITSSIGLVITFVLVFYGNYSGLFSSIAGFGLAFVISLVMIATDSKTSINPLPSEGRWFI